MKTRTIDVGGKTYKKMQQEKKKARAEKLAKLMGKNTEEIKDEAKENN